MYIIDGIAYAGELPKPIRVVSARALEGHKLWLRFSTDEEKIFDATSLLDMPCFKPLNDENLFRSVYVDYGVPTWNDGAIDFAPDMLYKKGISL